MRIGSLFSGIGGLELGLERAGMTVAWQSEIDSFASRVLAKHWPEVPNLGDITKIEWSTVEHVDLICGGFPCQDLSVAGRGAGLAGEHSGLWAHFARAIRDLRPRFVLVENSPALPVRGLGEVVADLAGLGYDAEWDCLPAAAVGAPHLRARTWLLAYPARVGDGVATQPVLAGRVGLVDGDRWASEPGIRRVDDGVPDRVDRLRCLGNAVVPQVAELIGRRIMAADMAVAVS